MNTFLRLKLWTFLTGGILLTVTGIYFLATSQPFGSILLIAGLIQFGFFALFFIQEKRNPR